MCNTPFIYCDQFSKQNLKTKRNTCTKKQRFLYLDLLEGALIYIVYFINST